MLHEQNRIKPRPPPCAQPISDVRKELGANSFDQVPGLSEKTKCPYIVLEDHKQWHQKENVKSKPGGKETKEVLELK